METPEAEQIAERVAALLNDNDHEAAFEVLSKLSDADFREAFPIVEARYFGGPVPIWNVKRAERDKALREAMLRWTADERFNARAHESWYLLVDERRRLRQCLAGRRRMIGLFPDLAEGAALPPDLPTVPAVEERIREIGETLTEAVSVLARAKGVPA